MGKEGTRSRKRSRRGSRGRSRRKGREGMIAGEGRRCRCRSGAWSRRCRDRSRMEARG